MTASREREVDLSTCDREPIHVPGAIQPHGVLFALSMPGLTVTQVSESVVHHLGVGVDDVLGRPLTGVLTRASAERVAAVLAHGSWRDENPLRVTAHDTEHDGILHEHDGVAILELEPARAEAGSARTHRPLLAAIQRAGTLEELSAIVVDAVKRLSKFERVMLYRFADDGSGSVDAEAKEAALEPYLGLRYPASDIPRQARELYLKSWLRIIPDRQYVPSRLVPSLRPDTGRPLDLTFSVLRSVSPIHLQYMANMGVHASDERFVDRGRSPVGTHQLQQPQRASRRAVRAAVGDRGPGAGGVVADRRASGAGSGEHSASSSGDEGYPGRPRPRRARR